jgi:hypothetical protein
MIEFRTKDEKVDEWSPEENILKSLEGPKPENITSSTCCIVANRKMPVLS